MKLLLAAASLGALAGTCVANDPSGGWLSYVTYTDPQDRRITALNTTWNVPSKPESLMGSNAPGWWFGIQTKDGDGALIQPILAWGYEGDRYTIFDACFDWTDGSWHTSEDSYTVQPGDTVSSSITYREEDNSYDMYIVSHQTGKSVSMNYQIQDAQHKNESQAYFVLEHQPNRCSAYPSSGLCTFENIYLEVDGEEVSDVAWEAKQENPMCDSKATVVDSKVRYCTRCHRRTPVAYYDARECCLCFLPDRQSDRFRQPISLTNCVVLLACACCRLSSSSGTPRPTSPTTPRPSWTSPRNGRTPP